MNISAKLPVLATFYLVLLVTPIVTSSEKVQVELYYESQCPGCRDTITRSFKEAYNADGFLKMANVTLVPFGNAHLHNDGSIECQHGPSECHYNIMETCALAKINCPFQQFKLIDCIENYDENRKAVQDYEGVLRACAYLTNNKHAADEIMTCYEGPEGRALEHDMATKTAALSPPHEYVPWIVVGKTHDEKVQDAVMDSLLQYVCSVYNGPDKSADCRPSGLLVAQGDPKADVCHRGAAANVN